MYRLLSYLLLMLTQVWAFVVNLPKSKIVKKLSQGFSKLIGSTVWDPRSIRHMSHELLREAGRLTPSRAFLPRLNSMTSSMLVARSRAASILDDWGFHVDHDNLESKKDEVDPVHPRRRDFSEHSTHIHEGCQKFELREADINDEAVNLDDLWKWEDENMRYCLHREELTKHDYDSEGPSISPTSVTQVRFKYLKVLSFFYSVSFISTQRSRAITPISRNRLSLSIICSSSLRGRTGNARKHTKTRGRTFLSLEMIL